jgi:hypothetical protein
MPVPEAIIGVVGWCRLGVLVYRGVDALVVGGSHLQHLLVHCSRSLGASRAEDSRNWGCEEA